MGRKSKDWLMVAAALLSSCGCYAWSVWASPDFGQFADQSEALAFAHDFDRAWRDGGFPPGWAPTANGGRGSLGFVVYPPFFSLLTAAIARTDCSIQDALQWAVVVLTVGIFWAVYFLARSWLGPRRSGLAAALALLLPGTVFISVGRGMFANYSALLWLALFWGAAERANAGRRVGLWMLVMVASGSGLALSHTLTAYLFFLLLAGLVLPLFLTVGWRGLALAGAVLAGILAVTDWYWIPLVDAGKYTQARQYAARHPYSASTFFGSMPADSQYRAGWGGLHFAGKMVMGAQLVLGMALAIASRQGIRTARAPRRERGGHSTRNSQRTDEPLATPSLPAERARRDVSQRPAPLTILTLPWVCALVALASFEPFAGWLTAVPYFDLTQFAWRWQLFLSLWCALGLAAVGRGFWAGTARFATLFVLFLSAPMFWASAVAAEGDTGTVPAAIAEGELDRQSAEVRAAYPGNIIAVRPKGADHTYFLPAEPGRVEVISGDAKVVPIKLRASRREYRVEGESPSVLRFYTYHFPGWTAELDGEPVPIGVEAGTALQVIYLPPGGGTLSLTYRVPWLW